MDKLRSGQGEYYLIGIKRKHPEVKVDESSLKAVGGVRGAYLYAILSRPELPAVLIATVTVAALVLSRNRLLPRN